MNKRQRLLISELEQLVDELLEADPSEIEDLLDSIWIPAQKEWTKNIKAMITESTLKGSVRAGKEIDQLFKKFAQEIGDVSFDNILPVEALAYIDAYSPVIASITDDTAKEAIKDTLKQAIANGDSRKQIMSDLNDVTGNVFSKARLESIARTESMKFYNAGRVQRYSDPDLDGFVTALQYDSIIDARTTDICTQLDGKVVDINDRATIAKFTPPNHYQCRATWLPISEYEDIKPNWDNSIQPLDGFEGTPNLFGGEKAAVAEAPKTDPTIPLKELRKMTKEQWAAMDDAQFKKNISRMNDNEFKIEIAQERAERMFREKAGLPLQAAPEKVNAQVYQSMHGITYRVDNAQTVVKLKNPESDGFSRLLTEAINKGIKDGKIDLSELKLDFPERAAEFRKLGPHIQHLNEKLANGRPPSLDFDFLQDYTVDKDAKRSLFGKIKVESRNAIGSPGTQGFEKRQMQAVRNMKAEAEEWFTANTDPSIYKPGFKKMKVSADFQNSRAYATRSGVFMDARGSMRATTMVHEYSHVIAINNPDMEKFIQVWFQKRTKGLKPGTINSVGEQGIKDSFISGYVGRIYDHEDKNNPLGYEVISMGMQSMYENPELFYAQDPDHFWLIYAVMNGLF